MPYFAQLGFASHPQENPADHIMFLLQDEGEARRRAEKMQLPAFWRGAEARVELETELERINALEDAKVAEGKHVLLQHRDLLKNQIDQKRFEGAASQFNKKQEKMMAERAEAQYQAMLQEQMTKTMANMQKFSEATKGMTS